MKRQTHLTRVVLTLTLLVACLLASPASAGALVDAADPLQISVNATGILLGWNAPPHAFSQSAPALALVPIEIGGALIPAHLIALRLPNDAPLALRIEQMASVPWSGELPASAAPIPQTASGDERPGLAQPAPRALPRSPLAVLRDGRMRGVRIVILAFSPIFLQGGALRSATTLQARIAGATLFAGDAAQILKRREAERIKRGGQSSRGGSQLIAVGAQGLRSEARLTLHIAEKGIALLGKNGPDHDWCNADPSKAIPRLRHPERLHVLAPGEKYILHKIRRAHV